MQTSNALDRSLVIRYHTMLPATRQRWFSRLYPCIHHCSFNHPAEGGSCIDLGTAVRVHNPYPRLYIAVVIVINTRPQIKMDC